MWILIFSIMYGGEHTATTTVDFATKQACQFAGQTQKAEVERVTNMAKAAFTCAPAA